jgi:pheromone shutdown-related protein TraB
MIKIIGTSHIAKESVEEIKRVIEEFKPEIVAIELDAHRATALLSNQKSKISLSDIKKIGMKGFIFAKVGQIVQKKLGKMVGVSPGSEMKTALLVARKKKLIIALIDQPIDKTLKNFSKELTWSEKFRFITDLVSGVFFKNKKIKEYGLDTLDLKKVPTQELIEKMMQPMKKRFPNVYKTLVEDRNKYMVKKLIKLLRAHPGKKIVCVVGAGHKQGMEELLLKVEVV